MIEFTLTYDGDLRPNGDPSHKHSLRRTFHAQLRHLWKNPAPRHLGQYGQVRPDVCDPGFHLSVGRFRFLPVISLSAFCVADVEVTMLTPEAGGSVITRGGDIDNRLKTLFDAMKVPTQQELPEGTGPALDETPFWCVLEDDCLVRRVAVETRRLLDPTITAAKVRLLINVRGHHVSELGLWVGRNRPGR